jgi:8-oxo-dGTP diphosphatase
VTPDPAEVAGEREVAGPADGTEPSGVVLGAADGAERPGVVVGAAIVRGAALLAARRAHPAELAGRWELPGGQVEDGEPEPDALRRECREELGAGVLVGERLGPDLPIGSRLLRVYRAVLEPGSPEPSALEHTELRWVARDELDGLDWLDADRALLPDLAAALT